MITTLIKRIARRLDEGGGLYMIIGGQAVLLCGTPRLTRDIDYLRRWLLEFGELPGYERILTDFEDLLNGRSDAQTD